MEKNLSYVLLVVSLVLIAWGCKNKDSATDESKTQEEIKSTSAIEKKETAQSNVLPQEKENAMGKAPDKFVVKFETTEGDVVIDVNREWAPLGVDHFHRLVKSGYYSDVAFFRVVKGFMAQVGISGDPEVNAKWRKEKIDDDPVVKSNTKGMVTFATSGPDSRTTQFFINFGDNSRLDSMGFAPFGKVRDMAVVDAINGEYGEGAPRGRGPSQGRIHGEGNAYLKKEFPNLDYIKSASVIEE